MARTRTPQLSSRNKSIVAARTNNECCYCNVPLEWDNITIEHVWDRMHILHVFGVYLRTRWNTHLGCLIACRHCNNRRGIENPVQYAQKRKSKHVHLIDKILDSPPIELKPPIFQFINKDGLIVMEIAEVHLEEAKKVFWKETGVRAKHAKLHYTIREVKDYSFDVDRQTIDLEDGMGII